MDKYEKIKSMFSVLAVVALIVAALFAISHQFSDENREIKAWCVKQGEVATNIDYTFIGMGGPYIVRTQYDHIYKVSTDKKNIYWFRYRIPFSKEVERENPDGSFTELTFDE